MDALDKILIGSLYLAGIPLFLLVAYRMGWINDR